MMHFAFSSNILFWCMGAWRLVNYTMIIKKLRQRCMKIFMSIIGPKNTKWSIKLSLYFHIKWFENWVQFRLFFHKIKISDSRVIINKMTKYLNPNNKGVFIGPQISEWTKWKRLLTRLSRLEAKGTLWCLPN